MTSKKRIGVVADRDFFVHQIPANVRESPARLRSLYQRIEQPDIAQLVTRCKAREALESELLAVHSEMYLSQLRHHSLSSDPFAYDKDTYLMEDTPYAASLAAGGCLTLADALMGGEIESGLALVRPPGHHAGIGNGAGFCVYNNVAILARYLQRRYECNRILILDVDAHHGNGTQEIFWEDPGVLFVSIHEADLFPPRSGAADEVGGGAGSGYTVNIPVKPGFADLEYNYLIATVVQELIIQYGPQIVLISVGFDGHIDDTISDLALTTEWYRRLAQTLGWYAETYGVAGLLYVLEGGYNPVCLETSVVELLRGMAAPPRAQDVPFSKRASDLLKQSILPKLSKKWVF